ncbi:MAG: hypothetical protein ABSA82_10560 [Thermacetogeniaceae bacterium]
MATYKISAALCPSSLLDLGGAFQQNLCRTVTNVVVCVSSGLVKGYFFRVSLASRCLRLQVAPVCTRPGSDILDVGGVF